MSRRLAGLLLVGAVATGACASGSDDEGPLGETTDALAELRSATLELRLEAAALDGPADEVVGFTVAGPFSLPDDGGLPVARLESTRLVGTEEISTTLIATGDAAFVEVDGTAYELTEEQTALLRLPGAGADEGDDDAGPLGGLRLDQWIIDPVVADEGDTEVISGEADVSVVLGDLVAVSAGFEAGPPVLPLDGPQGDALTEAVRSATVEVVVDRDDHDLRRLTFEALLGADLPDELGEALGSFAGAVLRFEVTLSDHGEVVEVDPPPDPRPASELTDPG